jgi:MFS family permease
MLGLLYVGFCFECSLCADDRTSRNPHSFSHKVRDSPCPRIVITNTHPKPVVSTALCILHWGRLSDRIGRRPVILIGLIGLALSMLCFGFAQSFTGVVFSRVIAGALNGNVGVTKTMVSSFQHRGSSSNTHGAKIAELGTEENRTMLFTFIPITWIIGATIGEYASVLVCHM